MIFLFRYTPKPQARLCEFGIARGRAHRFDDFGKAIGQIEPVRLTLAPPRHDWERLITRRVLPSTPMT